MVKKDQFYQNFIPIKFLQKFMNKREKDRISWGLVTFLDRDTAD